MVFFIRPFGAIVIISIIALKKLPPFGEQTVLQLGRLPFLIFVMSAHSERTSSFNVPEL